MLPVHTRRLMTAVMTQTTKKTLHRFFSKSVETYVRDMNQRHVGGMDDMTMVGTCFWRPHMGNKILALERRYMTTLDC